MLNMNTERTDARDKLIASIQHAQEALSVAYSKIEQAELSIELYRNSCHTLREVLSNAQLELKALNEIIAEEEKYQSD